MTGISNICHLRHDLQQCDCTIKSFGRQTSREMTCYYVTEVIHAISTQSNVILGKINHMRSKMDRIRTKSAYNIDNLSNFQIT